MPRVAGLLLAMACGMVGRTAPLSQAPPGGGRASAPYTPYASYPAAAYPTPAYAPVVQRGQETEGIAAASAATPGRPAEAAGKPRHGDRESDSGTESSWLREPEGVYANVSFDEVYDELRLSSSHEHPDSG